MTFFSCFLRSNHIISVGERFSWKLLICYMLVISFSCFLSQIISFPFGRDVLLHDLLSMSTELYRRLELRHGLVDLPCSHLVRLSCLCLLPPHTLSTALSSGLSGEFCMISFVVFCCCCCSLLLLLSSAAAAVFCCCCCCCLLLAAAACCCSLLLLLSSAACCCCLLLLQSSAAAVFGCCSLVNQ